MESQHWIHDSKKLRTFMLTQKCGRLAVVGIAAVDLERGGCANTVQETVFVRCVALTIRPHDVRPFLSAARKQPRSCFRFVRSIHKPPRRPIQTFKQGVKAVKRTLRCLFIILTLSHLRGN